MPTEICSPLTDPERLAALTETGLLDSAPEQAFDRFTRLAARLLHVPVVLVSLVTPQRQFFKSATGLPAPLSAERETPLSHSFCRHVVDAGQPLVIEDAREHPQGRDNLAVSEMGVRAYAGIPLVTSDGYTLGSFCAIDMQPRAWTEDDLSTLETLANSVMAEIDLRLAATRAQRQARERTALLNATAEGIYGIDHEGRGTFVNAAAARMLGYAPEALQGRNLHEIIHSRRADGSPYPETQCPIYQVVQTGQNCRVEEDVFWRQDGTAFPVEFSSSPLDGNGQTRGAVVAFADISARKEAEASVRASWDRDRRVAETLQRAILQDVVENRFPGLMVAARYLPAWQEARIGGDFYDAFALDGGRVAFVVGDASGKGLAAAVRTAEAKFALRAFLREDAAPGEALARLNNLLCSSQRLEGRPEDAFVALTLAVVETQTGEAVFGSAGAEPALILRAHGDYESVEARGLPLGFLPAQEYQPISARLASGDAILLATDGLTEARQGSFFLGSEGLADLACRAASASASVDEIAQAILDGARAFANGTLHDDACLFFVRRA